MHMIHVEKKLLCLTLFVIGLCVGSDVIAHPHVFIVQRLKIVFDDQGLAGFGVEWQFDAKKRPARVENEDRFVIESAIKEDKSTSIYFGMVNPFL
jgi:ABC-type uncharacterized transport system substrate-binding protein